MNGHRPPGVSFIVPVRNDAWRLAQCLRSVERERPRDGLMETIVIDGGSTDGSDEVARRMGARVIMMPDARVAAMRNTAAAEATGDILAFVDADNEIVSGWLAAAVDALQTPSVAAAGAMYLAPADATWVQRAYEYLRGRTRGRQYVDWLGSGNLAIWRDVFHASSGFDVRLETCEDVDLCHRIRSIGLRIVGDARLASVHHGDPRTLWDVFRDERWRGRDNLRVSFRRPLSWSALPSAIIPLVDVVMIAAGVLGLFATVRSPKGLVASSVAMSVVAAGAFLKVVHAWVREGNPGGGGILPAFVVACAYDVGRALALISRVSHRSTPPSSAALP